MQFHELGSTSDQTALMKRTYTHLTQAQRYTISAELKSGKRLGQIAKDLGISRPTLWRELKRNSGKNGYLPKQAHIKAQVRRNAGNLSISDFGHYFVAHKLQSGWSPEQISAALTAQGWVGAPCHEWIYRFVYSEQGRELDLISTLRHQKKYRKRNYKTQDRRGKVARTQSIHQRPIEAHLRSRIGDLEGDTMIGKHHKGALLTLVDRKSLYVWIEPLPHRYAQSTAQACINSLKNFKAHTITFDNGKEFAMHEHIAQQTKADIYFADPYQSNQRARNENTNGLIRQYLPKSSVLDNISHEHTQKIAYKLNNRPRKTLNWLTPAQVLAGNQCVALRC
jgi:IS30 family transposase